MSMLLTFFDAKESGEHALNFGLYLSLLFLVSVSLEFPRTAHAFFPERKSNKKSALLHSCVKFSKFTSKIC